MRNVISVHLTASLLAFAANATALADQSPPLPDAMIDLRTTAGITLANGAWRYTDAHIVDADFHSPSGAPAKTHDIHPRIASPDFEKAEWISVTPESLEVRRTGGRLGFGWYRLDLTIPETINGFATGGSTVVFETTVDDYAEIWLDGSLPLALGQRGGQLPSGWNAPSRATVARNAKPGQQIHLAIFAANGPLSDPPPNYVWLRSATLDFYKPGRDSADTPAPVDTRIIRLDAALDRVIAPGTRAEKLAGGFAFTEGPIWVPQLSPGNTYGGGGRGGYLLFSDPNKNVIHRWDPATCEVSIFRTKSGYYGDASAGAPNIGEYHQPGSNGLTLSPDGRLTMCEHGNRRITRLEPNGSITVLADRFDGKRLNSPNDLVYRSDGTLYFTDPPFGLPKVFDDKAKELSFSGVFMVKDGRTTLASRDLAAPNGLAFSPDEKHLYVDNWEVGRKIILRYNVASDGGLSNPTLFFDMTSTPGEIALDGLKVDRRRNVLVCGPGGIWIISSAGTHLGTISLPEQPANIAFGPDQQSLFIAARTGIYRINLATPLTSK